MSDTGDFGSGGNGDVEGADSRARAAAQARADAQAAYGQQPDHEPEVGSSEWLLQQLSGGRLTTRRQIREAEAAAAAAGIPLESFPQQTGAVEPIVEPTAAEPTTGGVPEAGSEGSPEPASEPVDAPTESAAPIAAAEVPAAPAPQNPIDEQAPAESPVEEERPRARFSWETGTMEPLVAPASPFEPAAVEPPAGADPDDADDPDDESESGVPAPVSAGAAASWPEAPVPVPVVAAAVVPEAEIAAEAPAQSLAAEPAGSAAPVAAESAAEDGGYFWGLVPNEQLDSAVHEVPPVSESEQSERSAQAPTEPEPDSKAELESVPEPVVLFAPQPEPVVEPAPESVLASEPESEPAAATEPAFDAQPLTEPAAAPEQTLAPSDDELGVTQAFSSDELAAALAREPLQTTAPDASTEAIAPEVEESAAHSSEWEDIHALFGHDDAEADTNEVPVQHAAAAEPTWPAGPLAEPTEPAWPAGPIVEQAEPAWPARPIAEPPASLAGLARSSEAHAPVFGQSAPQLPVAEPAVSPFAAEPLVSPPVALETGAGEPPHRMATSTKVLLWILGIVVLAGIVLGLFAFGSWLIDSNKGSASAPTSNAQGTQANDSTDAASVSRVTDSTPAAQLPATGTLPAGSYSWDQLRGGECLDPFTGAWAQQFTVVDCATPHAAQLVLAAPYPGASFPGEDAIEQQINALCTAPGVIDLGKASAIDDLQVVASYPVNQQQWDAGQKDYFCFVQRSSQQPLTASLRGAGPQA